ncbi:hypothetical protein Tco_0246639 [Tanacetum coccineum]
MIRMRDDIPEEDMPPQKRFVLTDPPPRCDVAESSAPAAARPPRGQYDFVDTVEAGRGLIRSPGHDAWTIARAADIARDVGYVRALRAFEHKMMTSIEEVNLRTDRRDIRLEIDIVRGQRTAYETEFHEVRQAYLSPKAQNRALLAQLETLAHMSRMEWQRQSAKDFTVRQMMHTQVQEARARIHTVEDADSKIKKLEIELWNLKTEKVDKYISGLLDNIHGNVMSARPKTLNDAIELANDLMDQKLRTYAERQNENKRKADDSSRNNQQQQPHKKQNVARAYTAGPGEKKAYTRNLPLCTKFNYHHTGQCAPKCGNCKRYGHTTNNCQKNCPKLKNHGNGNKNGIAQGRAYALGGRDASPDSNIITGTFLFNNRYAIILFDTGADRSFIVCVPFRREISKQWKQPNGGIPTEDVPIVTPSNLSMQRNVEYPRALHLWINSTRYKNAH